MDLSYARARAIKPALQYRYRTRAAVVVRAVRRWLPGRPVRLLEVGAADGRTLVEFSESFGRGEYVGIERDASLCHAHVPLPPDARIIHGDAAELPPCLADGSFSVVSMLALLEHLPDSQAALAEAYRVLEPGGLLVATCPNPWWDAVAGRLGLVDGDFHLRGIDERMLADQVRSGGFEIAEVGRFMWAPVAFLPYLRIPVSPCVGLAFDFVAGRLPGLRRLCVNAYVVGRKPSVLSF